MAATKQRLPNLKICVDNTESTDESDVEIKTSSTSSESDEDKTPQKKNGKIILEAEDGEVKDDQEDVLSISVDKPTERRFLSRRDLALGSKSKETDQYGPRVYENKSGGFVTGVDLTLEAAVKQREERAKRFGTISNAKHPITDVDLKLLHKSLGMNVDTLDQDSRGWRQDVIMLRGVQNMSTQDVFQYFQEFGPKNLEWIDDNTCNVVWLDKLTPARALINLSCPMDDFPAPKKPVQSNSQENKDQPGGEDKPMTSEAKADIKEDLPNVSKAGQPQLAGEEESMELDFDDNLDLNIDDPLDEALKTWSKKATESKDKKEEQNEGAVSGKGKEHLSEKEKKSLTVPEKECDEAVKSINVEKKAVSDKKSESKSERKDHSVKLSEKNSNNRKQSVKEVQPLKFVEKKNAKSKYVEKYVEKEKKDKSGKVKKPVKMETEDGSDSDGSSSSSDSSSSNSSSSSSSSSGSESGSSSESSSSSSSSSSSDSSEGERKKVRKSASERNRDSKRPIKKPEAPPVPPPFRDLSNIPWPPGFWRLGAPHKKAEYLFLRFAMKADKKLPGAEKRSQYYLKNGNPNYGGLKGIISNSRKRRMRYKDDNKQSEGELDDSADEEAMDSVRSRLSGRLGYRDQRSTKLQAGKDLRDRLNQDLDEIKGKAPEKQLDSGGESDEMDYKAELDLLMGDEPPPTKKRFMRMHADDEEKIIQTKRVAKGKEKAERQLREFALNYDSYRDDDRVLDVGWDEPQVYKDDTWSLQTEPDISEAGSKFGEYVDLDNVGDDDPHNLFGTSTSTAVPVTTASDSEEEWRGSRSGYSSRQQDDDRMMGLRADNVVKGDLRAKLMGRKKNNRNW